MSEFSLICVTSVGKPPITFVKHDLEDLNCLQQTRLSVDLILDPLRMLSNFHIKEIFFWPGSTVGAKSEREAENS